MKKSIAIALLIVTASWACGPYFPSSYLGDYDSRFEAGINPGEELELIARAYGLIDDGRYPHGWMSTMEAEKSDFQSKASDAEEAALLDDYLAYAEAVRAGDAQAVCPDLPEHLLEFRLYLEGTAEFKADAQLTFPEAWKKLLALDAGDRLYRTVWTHYMLGNLAASHGLPEQASVQYERCRTAAQETEKDAPLGLAHASYRRDYLAQTNLNRRIERGIAAIGHYNRSYDLALKTHCLEHFERDMQQAAEQGVENPSMAVLEAMALYRVGKAGFFQTLVKVPDLKITPRLAWFMYKNGEPELAAAYLEHCPDTDTLANWIRYRLAQRSGNPDEAVALLKKWLANVQTDRRMIFQFHFRDRVSNRSAIHGSLGMLYVEQGHMLDALDSFMQAGAYLDAALIAERYLETDELKRYVDTLDTRAPYHDTAEYEDVRQTENRGTGTELRLAYLLARRLFREGRPEEALPYYPPEIARCLDTYLEAGKLSRKFLSRPDTRSAHLYHAARILRWKGMELSGTELYPDYTIENGHFAWAGIANEDAIVTGGTPPIYEQTAPVPNLRFHYRHAAAALAGQAARLSWNKHQKAMILWSAGSWIQNRHPEEADVYYKQLASIHFQPLAAAADEQRWFPEASPMMDYVNRAEDFIPPRRVAGAAEAYETD